MASINYAMRLTANANATGKRAAARPQGLTEEPLACASRWYCRPGMTLVELVVALALGALLMAALVGVIRSVATQVRVAQHRAADHWETAATELLHRDLMLSVHIAYKDGWIWLDGEFPDYQNVSGRTQRVGYNCVPWLGNENALVRITAASTDLVAVGPRRLLIERLDQTSVPQPLSEAPTAIPERLRLWIWAGDAAEPTVVRDVVVR